MDIENQDIQAFIETVRSQSDYDFSDYSDFDLMFLGRFVDIACEPVDQCPVVGV
jgi:hypothetical protein